MLSKITTAGLCGIEAYPVTVETDTSRGLPSFSVVGLPSATVKEAKERVRAAVLNCGYDFPVSKITVNLSPAGNRKEGSYFDLPMALGVLAATELVDQAALEGYGIMGELALDGQIKHIDGALPLVIGLVQSGVGKIMLPSENIEEASMVNGAELYPVRDLKEAVEHLTGERMLTPVCSMVGVEELTEKYDCDFSEVKGQEAVKRAISVSVAGGHGVYLHGFPGSGKSMLAKRIPTIMPPLTYDEMLELTMIYSVAGKLSVKEPLVRRRPFREPHHSITRAALMGGERRPKPGEVSLAHRGVLFLDEFPEFGRETLETLRQPVESGEIVVQRADGSITFPCEFILVAAGNPCRCGYYGSKYKECKCSMGSVERYRSKLSGPLIDRIDMHIAVAELEAGKLICGQEQEEEACATSAELREIVGMVREVQRLRYGNGKILNGSLEGEAIEKYCKLTDAAKDMLLQASERFCMSMRSCTKVIKVARTIADMEGCELIGSNHVAEALRYRELDKIYER